MESNWVGIYRGSFDPPHNGHLEAVTCALQNGISPITIIYQDPNPHKPFRSHNDVRRKFLITMFANMPNVIISNKTYKAVMTDLLTDKRVNRIYQIMGSDLLSLPIRPIKDPANLAYFIHDRGDLPSLKDMRSWNGLPVKIAFSDHGASDPSSTKIRSLLQEREFEEAKSYFPSDVFNQVISESVYVPTENEFPYRHMLQLVKKSLEKQISQQKLVSPDHYPLTFQLGKDIGISGLSGDLVCFISDQHQMRFVVKIFLGQFYLENYESEILGYRILSDLNLKYVKVPKLFIQEAQKDFAFIGMDFCAGKSLAELMEHSPEAVKLCAKANLELNTARRVQGDVLPEQIAHFEKILPQVAPKLQVDILPKISEHWTNLHTAFINNPGKRSFTHGDPNQTNCFVDVEKQQVTYIDLSLFSRSVCNQETPCGFAINELQENLLTIKIAAKKLGISNEKTKEIQNTFESAYREDAPSDLTTKEAEQYFTAYWTLRVIDNILDRHPEMNLKYQEQVNDLISNFLKPLNES